jgi:hypothetical protein
LPLVPCQCGDMSAKPKDGNLWSESRFHDEWSLVASFLRDYTPEQRERELAAMKPYYREGVMGWLESYAEPPYSSEEQDFINWLERYRGEKLTPQEKHLAVKQAKNIGDL